MEQEQKKETKKVVKAPRVKSKAPVRFALAYFNKICSFFLKSFIFVLDYG